MIFESLEKDLKEFDYTYMMSDDYRVWRNGTSNRDRINLLINECAKINEKKTVDLIIKYKQKYGTQFEVKDE